MPNLDIDSILQHYERIDPRFVPWSIPQIVAHIQDYLDDHPIADADTLQAVVNDAYETYIGQIDTDIQPYLREISTKVTQAQEYSESAGRSAGDATAAKGAAEQAATQVREDKTQIESLKTAAQQAATAAATAKTAAETAQRECETIETRIRTFTLRGTYTAAVEDLALSFATPT